MFIDIFPKLILYLRILSFLSFTSHNTSQFCLFLWSHVCLPWLLWLCGHFSSAASASASVSVFSLSPPLPPAPSPFSPILFPSLFSLLLFPSSRFFSPLLLSLSFFSPLRHVLKISNPMGGEMAQWIGALTPNPDDQNLTPRIHMMGRENWLPQVTLWPPHMHCSTLNGHK